MKAFYTQNSQRNSALIYIYIYYKMEMLQNTRPTKVIDLTKNNWNNLWKLITWHNLEMLKDRQICHYLWWCCKTRYFTMEEKIAYGRSFICHQ